MRRVPPLLAALASALRPRKEPCYESGFGVPRGWRRLVLESGGWLVPQCPRSLSDPNPTRAGISDSGNSIGSIAPGHFCVSHGQPVPTE